MYAIASAHTRASQTYVRLCCLSMHVYCVCAPVCVCVCSLFSLDCAQPKLRTRDSALHTGTTLASAQRHNIEGTWQSKHVKDSDTHDTHNAHTGNGPTGSDGRPLIV